jgi:hypothetical protein
VVGIERTRELYMRIAAIILVALSCAFYVFVLVQFWRERRRSKRTPGSLTFLASSEEPTVPLPAKRDEQPAADRNSQRKHKLVPISKRPVIRAAATASQEKRNSDWLPYVEIALPITAIVTPVTAARDDSHRNVSSRRTA